MSASPSSTAGQLLKLINQQIQNLDKELAKAGQEDLQANRLMTIPGVGVATGVAVSCWIGDIRRFPNAKKLVSYFGLAPRVRQSAGRKDTDILPRKEAAWPDGFYCRRLWSIFEWPSNLLAAIILE